jgi:hypothetical protein
MTPGTEGTNVLCDPDANDHGEGDQEPENAESREYRASARNDRRAQSWLVVSRLIC